MMRMQTVQSEDQTAREERNLRVPKAALLHHRVKMMRQHLNLMLPKIYHECFCKFMSSRKLALGPIYVRNPSPKRRMAKKPRREKRVTRRRRRKARSVKGKKSRRQRKKPRRKRHDERERKRNRQ